MIKQLSSAAAASVAILVFTGLGSVISARFLLPTGKGQLTAVILWPTFLATIGSLGLVEAVTYFSARQRQTSHEFLSAALVVSLGTSVVLAAGGYFLLPFVLSNYDAHTIQSARGFLAYIPITLTATLMMAALQGNLRLRAYNVLRAMVQILTVIGMVLAIAVGRGSVRSFVAATLAANAITLAVATVVVLKSGWIRWPFPSFPAGPLLRFGLQSHAGSLASMMNVRLDQMLMSAMISAPLLGLYVVAVAVAALATLPLTTLNVIAVPRIASEADPAARVASWGRLLRFSLLLQLVFGCALWAIAPYVVRVCFGPSFEPSTNIARILIVASLPLGMNMILGIGFRASNRPLTPSTAEMISLAITVAGLWWLLPRYGIEGAAWTSVLAYGVASVFLFSRVYRQLGITPRQLLEPTCKDLRDVSTLFLRQQPERV